LQGWFELLKSSFNRRNGKSQRTRGQFVKLRWTVPRRSATGERHFILEGERDRIAIVRAIDDENAVGKSAADAFDTA